ncbi:MAG: hypothetical protein V1800_12230 [Candidatus Latescibacterota bacterium]
MPSHVSVFGPITRILPAAAKPLWRYPYDQGETIGRVSADGGKTWARTVYHLSDGSGYAASVVLSDGTIVTVVGNIRLDGGSMPIEPWSVQAVRWRPEED